MSAERVETLVIGAGQAGLAMGYYLAERGPSFVIADANPEIGHVWRSRWHSLKLFTAGQYNDLPGMRFPAERDTYPGKDDVAGGDGDDELWGGPGNDYVGGWGGTDEGWGGDGSDECSVSTETRHGCELLDPTT